MDDQSQQEPNEVAQVIDPQLEELKPPVEELVDTEPIEQPLEEPIEEPIQEKKVEEDVE